MTTTTQSNPATLFEVAAGRHTLTQLGNAERFFDLYGNDVLYCPKIKQWYVWDGSRWAPDEMLVVRSYMTKTVRTILQEAQNPENSDRRNALLLFAMASETNPNICGALEHAKILVPIKHEALDQDIWLLNFANGTLDLQSDGFRECRREDRLTKSVPYDYDDFLLRGCPQWEQFLKEIFPPPYEEIIPFIQRAVGYSLTGNTDEHCLFLLHGVGANGKSVFIRTLQYVLGDYAAQSDWQSFAVKKGSGMEIREDIARLAGARFVSAVESAQHVRMAENVVKAITGGDKITARHLYKGSFEFIPQFKLWLASNYLPKIVGQDEGIWRRIMLIPFTVTFKKTEQDKQLAQKLMSEAPGILNWARKGLRDYLAQNGLNPPAAVLKATSEYRNESDQLNHFLNARTMASPTVSVRVDFLYPQYAQWTEATGETYTMPEREFNQALESRGMEKKHTNKGNVWLGLDVITEESVERMAAKERTSADAEMQETLF